ncbi:MAG: FAD-dependent oxidoreductase [Acidobacteria bacterium]|nr:FAD-dependent oxidoreductase [Acidobacteriota bacterium]
MSAGIVVIGGQASGLAAAVQARRRNSTVPVTVLEASPHAGTGVCGLPFLFTGEVASPGDLVLHRPEDLERHYRVRVRTGHRVTSVHPGRRVVRCALEGGGESDVPYDRLVLAAGARAAVPPEAAAAGPDGVFTLRTLSDAAPLLVFLSERRPRSVLVLGGGTLGIEMADVFARRGLEVTLVEREASLLPAWEPELALRASSVLAQRGVRPAPGSVVRELGHSGGAFHCRLGTGERISADFVFCACGVRPETAFLADLPLRFHPSGAVVVDARMETSVAGIYAAGDFAAAPSRPSGAPAPANTAVRAALTGGVAGDNAAGYDSRGGQWADAWCLRLSGLELAAAGVTGASARGCGLRAETVSIRAPLAPPYFRDRAGAAAVVGVFDTARGTLLGAHAAGPAGTAALVQPAVPLIAQEATAREILGMEFPYTPPLGTVRHPLQQLARLFLKTAGG